MKKIKKVIALILLLTLGFGGWRILGKKPPKTQYQTAQAEKGSLITAFTFVKGQFCASFFSEKRIQW
jgi:hypothetical protein